MPTSPPEMLPGLTSGSPETVAKDPRVQAAIEAYRRTLRNESGDIAPASEANSDERLLADRPPHWTTRSHSVPVPASRTNPRRADFVARPADDAPETGSDAAAGDADEASADTGSGENEADR